MPVPILLGCASQATKDFYETKTFIAPFGANDNKIVKPHRVLMGWMKVPSMCFYERRQLLELLRVVDNIDESHSDYNRHPLLTNDSKPNCVKISGVDWRQSSSLLSGSVAVAFICSHKSERRLKPPRHRDCNQ